MVFEYRNVPFDFCFNDYIFEIMNMLRETIVSIEFTGKIDERRLILNIWQHAAGPRYKMSNKKEIKKYNEEI